MLLDSIYLIRNRKSVSSDNQETSVEPFPWKEVGACIAKIARVIFSTLYTPVKCFGVWQSFAVFPLKNISKYEESRLEGIEWLVHLTPNDIEDMDEEDFTCHLTAVNAGRCEFTNKDTIRVIKDRVAIRMKNKKWDKALYLKSRKQDKLDMKAYLRESAAVDKNSSSSFLNYSSTYGGYSYYSSQVSPNNTPCYVFERRSGHRDWIEDHPNSFAESWCIHDAQNT